MRILVVTNLYPPQELGGYGRAIADFVWGLQLRGHKIQVLCTNAPYLGPGGDGPNGEPVDRSLQLKGNFQQGVQYLHDSGGRRAVDQANREVTRNWLRKDNWDGILLGNIDLLGHEILHVLLEPGIRVLHHVGFVAPPFPPDQLPKASHYRLVPASRAVRQSLSEAGLPVAEAAVVYPGARVDLFGWEATGRTLPPNPDTSKGGPLRVCFAGLMMSSKGPHTLLEAVKILNDNNVNVEAMLAGGQFQTTYSAEMENFIKTNRLEEHIRFFGPLKRPQLARFFRLNHVCVFPSIYPEAFGIVAAEGMGSGLALVSTGVGGAAELFQQGVSGLKFESGDALGLAMQLLNLIREPALLSAIQTNGEARVNTEFSVEKSVAQLEKLWAEGS